jgi:metallophosphoesterase superfamily enzyme
MSHPLLIHISDTPEFVYPFIFRLVEQLRPEVLIHTGDMFDEIKLEDRPKEIKEYSSKLKKIMNRLEQLPVKQIFLIPGNHDNTEVIMDLSRKIVVLPEKSRIELEGLSLFLSHKYYDQKVDTDFYLFGHSLPEINRLDIETKLLNGIPCINFISLSTGTTYTLNYPLGTDSTRMMLPKIGI